MNMLMKVNLVVLFVFCCSAVSAKMSYLASFTIGDRQLASMDENGLYFVTYNQLKDVLERQGLESKIIGLPVNQLGLVTSPVDTLSTKPVGNPRKPFGDSALFPVALDIRDHSDYGKGGPNQTFDEGDTLVFYGQGTSRWGEINTSDDQHKYLPYVFFNNPYSFTRKYYLTIGSSMILRPYSQNHQTSNFVNEDGLRLRRYEKDSILKDRYFGFDDEETGREFFWHWHGVNSDQMRWENLEEGHPQKGNIEKPSRKEAWLEVSFFPDRSMDNMDAYRSLYGQAHIGQLPHLERFRGFAPYLRGNGRGWVDPQNGIIVLSPSGFLGSWDAIQEKDNKFVLSFDLWAGVGGKKEADIRFDGLTLAWYSRFKYDSSRAYMLWAPPQAAGLMSFSVEQSRNVKVLRLVGGEWLGAMPQLKDTIFSDSLAWDRNWVLVSDSLLMPQIEAYVPNPAFVIDDLDNGANSAGKKEDPLNMIICPRLFLVQCGMLKKYRENEADFKIPVSIVVAEDIYKYYNAGQKTPESIRDYLRFSKSSWAKKLRSATLVGDGHVDPRNILGKWSESLFPVYSANDMGSDDFFGILDSGAAMTNQGPNSGNYKLSLAIGRLPIETPMQFEQYIDKIKFFEIKNRGPWRQKVTLMADDFRQGGVNDYVEHVPTSELLSKQIQLSAPWIQQEKIYLDNYEADASWKKYQANRDLVRSFDEGRYFVNYFGHGAVSVLSDEGLFDRASIQNFRKIPRSTLFTTFSCLVGRFDSPKNKSLMEDLFLSSPNGSVASVAATRDSWANNNEILAIQFYKNILDTSNSTLGMAFRAAKSSMPNSDAIFNAERYALLGDPEIVLPRTANEIKIDGLPKTVQALMPLKILGSAPGLTEGEVFVQLQEEPRIKVWVDDQVVGNNQMNIKRSATAIFEGKNIFSGKFPIKNGRFDFEFLTPKKINFGDSNARFVAYAWSEKSPKALTYNRTQISLEGTSGFASMVVDTNPPEIKLYPCRSVGRTPFGPKIQMSLPACFEVEVTDQIALDYSTGVDEGVNIEWVGRGNPWHPDFSFQSGQKAVFQTTLDNSLGEHRLRISAMDAFGNRLQREWIVELIQEQEGALFDVYSQPNPMRNLTRFHFKTPGHDNLRFNLRIFDQTGKLVRILKNVESGQTTWDGRDQWGNSLANGLYFYKIYSIAHIENSSTGQPEERVYSRLQKLVISR